MQLWRLLPAKVGRRDSPAGVAAKGCEHGDSCVDSADVLPPRKDVAAVHEGCGVC